MQVSTGIKNEDELSCLHRVDVRKDQWIRELTRWMAQLENDGYKLFSMSLTYISPKDSDHSPQFLSEIFNNLYWHQLLPKKIFMNKKWLKKRKGDQPILLLFVERHQEKGIKTYNPTMAGGFQYSFPDRLHHHAIVAVRQEHESAMGSLCAKDSLREFSPWVLTSDVQPADLGWIEYAAKDKDLSSDDYEIYGPEGSSFERTKIQT
ncbi:hypothetical protein [Hydrogenophaga sp. OTU3427]|uniref:hypothetical protein n=1 Tax=Hydrogenophaga sp. OTU3427 TaxID=3043856 RepID=UPI00313EF4EF